MTTTHSSVQLKTTRLESGLRLEYAEYGDAGADTLVLLHGITDSWFSFSRLLPLLDPSRYHAYAISQRATVTQTDRKPGTRWTTLPPTSSPSWTPWVSVGRPS